MKRILLGGLSVLLTSAIAAPAAVLAQEGSDNLVVQRDNIITVNGITPVNLVYQAYRGEFKNQGIPGYSGLIDAYGTRQVSAESLVKTAIAANLVSQEALNDQGYINAVDSQLRDFQNIGS
jgi:hypothetical protein